VPPSEICRADVDCGAGRACDDLLARCHNADGSCRADADCRPDHVCNRVLGLCTGCGNIPLPFLVCPDGQLCFADVCVPFQ